VLSLVKSSQGEPHCQTDPTDGLLRCGASVTALSAVQAIPTLRLSPLEPLSPLIATREAPQSFNDRPRGKVDVARALSVVTAVSGSDKKWPGQ
jgi:hypothetical protein